jgi:hypothetical protein
MTDESQPKRPPPGWGRSAIEEFLDGARGNEFASFVKHRISWDLLAAIDRLWDRWRDHPSSAARLVSILLRARCRGTYRAVVRLAVSGQPVEAFVLCRSVLEHAAYAGQAAWTPGAAEVWTDRMESDVARRSCRKTFGWSSVLAALGTQDPELSKDVSALYDDLIDQGAHPNPDATFGSLKLAKESVIAGPDLSVALLAPGGNLYKLGLSQTCRSGVLAHEVFGRIWPDVFAGRIQDTVRSMRDLCR